MELAESGARVVLGEKMIENPLATDGLVHAAIDEGEEQPRWVRVTVNTVTMVGGLARMKGLSEAQLAAAGRYRAISEMALIGGARATDYSAVRVDTSGSGRDVVEDGAAARRELAIARRKLGPFQASLLDKVVCDELSVREVAKTLGKGGGSGQLLTSKRVRVALDDLVDIFARGRRAVRATGAAAGDWSLPDDEDGAEPDKAH